MLVFLPTFLEFELVAEQLCNIRMAFGVQNFVVPSIKFQNFWRFCNLTFRILVTL
jgi:hypothetical protein